MSRHRFHGDPARFDMVAEFVRTRFPGRPLRRRRRRGTGHARAHFSKRLGVECDVIDPRGWTLRGVSSRAEEYSAEMADYYDLVVGLHPDEALRPVVDSALVRPVLVVPCCNFWSRGQRLGQAELLAAIADHHRGLGGGCEPVRLDFRGPKNRGVVLAPPRA